MDPMPENEVDAETVRRKRYTTLDRHAPRFENTLARSPTIPAQTIAQYQRSYETWQSARMRPGASDRFVAPPAFPGSARAQREQLYGADVVRRQEQRNRVERTGGPFVRVQHRISEHSIHRQVDPRIEYIRKVNEANARGEFYSGVNASIIVEAGASFAQITMRIQERWGARISAEEIAYFNGLDLRPTLAVGQTIRVPPFDLDLKNDADLLAFRGRPTPNTLNPDPITLQKGRIVDRYLRQRYGAEGAVAFYAGATAGSNRGARIAVERFLEGIFSILFGWSDQPEPERQRQRLVEAYFDRLVLEGVQQDLARFKTEEAQVAYILAYLHDLGNAQVAMGFLLAVGSVLNPRVLASVRAIYFGLRGIPQGLSEMQFLRMSVLLRREAGHISDDIAVHGSRASGSARSTSDIDIAIRVDAKKFDEIIKERFAHVNPGTAAERTRDHAIAAGKINSRQAGLATLKNRLEKLIGREVDLSVIRIGGPFDRGPWIDLAR
jgi:predicted nucleotidyltransferase